MAFEYRTELTDQILQSPQARRILSYLSPVYGDAYAMLWLIQIIGELLDRQKELVDGHILQAFPQTATWSIGLWEDQCAAKPDPEWDLAQRRWAVIAREKPTTPMGPSRLEEIAGNAAGGRVTIQENTGTNTFGVTFWEDPEGPTINLRSACRELDKFKPAHLVYRSELRMPPVALENPQAFYFVVLRIALRAQNRPGAAGLNLALGWAVENRRAAAFPRLLLRMGQQNRQRLTAALALHMGAAGQRKNSRFLLERLRWCFAQEERQGLAVGAFRFAQRIKNENHIRQGLTVRARVNAWGREIIRLDGSRRLDGTWTLDQHLRKGICLAGVVFSARCENRQSHTLRLNGVEL